jgi:hypothetical protein
LNLIYREARKCFFEELEPCLHKGSFCGEALRKRALNNFDFSELETEQAKLKNLD